MSIWQLEDLRGFICHTYISNVCGSKMSELRTWLICFLSCLHDEGRFSKVSLVKCSSVRRIGWLRLEEADGAEQSGFASMTPHFEFLIGFIHITSYGSEITRPKSAQLQETARNFKWQHFKFGLRLMSEKFWRFLLCMSDPKWYIEKVFDDTIWVPRGFTDSIAFLTNIFLFQKCIDRFDSVVLNLCFHRDWCSNNYLS